MNRIPEPDPEITDPALRALGERLDALGDAERAGPNGLEDRVLSAVAGTVAPGPIAMPTGPRWKPVAIRAAAGFAMLGVVSIAVYSVQRGVSVSPDRAPAVMALEERIDGLFAIGELDEGVSFEDSIASIELWADALDAEVAGDWPTNGYADDWFGEGAL